MQIIKAISTLACAFIVSVFCATQAAAKQPNIILYLSDDLGYMDVAFMGHPYAVTPNLDKLALSSLTDDNLIKSTRTAFWRVL